MYPNLNSGSNSFQVRARDSLGQLSVATPPYRWDILGPKEEGPINNTITLKNIRSWMLTAVQIVASITEPDDEADRVPSEQVLETAIRQIPMRCVMEASAVRIQRNGDDREPQREGAVPVRIHLDAAEHGDR